MAIQFEYNNNVKKLSSNVAYAKIYNVNNFNNKYVLIDVHIFLTQEARIEKESSFEVVKSFKIEKIIMKLKNPEEPESPENPKEPVINPVWTELHSGNIIVKSYEYLMQQTEYFKNLIAV
jgi:hypothetical protein